MNDRISTGIPGFDEILYGGFIPNRSYLLIGGPGTGKTTAGYQFLYEGIRNGETSLYITLSESGKSIVENASILGIDLSKVNFLDLSPSDDVNANSEIFNVFPTGEIEQEPLINAIVDAVEKFNPDRVFLDSVTLLRTLSSDPFQFRKLVTSFIKYICGKNSTLLMAAESDNSGVEDATFWVDGIVYLEYNPYWRKIFVTKYRGSDFIHGTHAFRILDHGIEVYPRLLPNNYERKFQPKIISSGIKELDLLLNGGLEKGTTTLIAGPSGVGKTNLGIHLLLGATKMGKHTVIYTFEESAELLEKRSTMIDVPVREMIEQGKLKIVSIEPFSYSPDEFALMVRKDVEENNTKVVMIDSVNGYNLSVREEQTLERLHSLSIYLQNMGVTSLLINETKNVTGDFETTNLNASYLADNIIFLRYIEMKGELRKAIGVLKKRLSNFERSIREFEITENGIKVGKKLNNMKGILTGLPDFMDDDTSS